MPGGHALRHNRENREAKSHVELPRLSAIRHCHTSEISASAEILAAASLAGFRRLGRLRLYSTVKLPFK